MNSLLSFYGIVKTCNFVGLAPKKERKKKKTPNFNQAAFRFVFSPPPPRRNRYCSLIGLPCCALFGLNHFFLLRSTKAAAKEAVTSLMTTSTTSTTSTHIPGVQSERTTVFSSFTNYQERFRPLFWQLLPPPRCRRVENFLIGARQVRNQIFLRPSRTVDQETFWIASFYNSLCNIWSGWRQGTVAAYALAVNGSTPGINDFFFKKCSCCRRPSATNKMQHWSWTLCRNWPIREAKIGHVTTLIGRILALSKILF